MQKCYLVIVTRNKWCDYELITDLPASLGRPEADLRRRMRSFFSLDYSDKDITASRRLLPGNVHLQMWCGRIDSFNLKGIPYCEQIGRPIKLGVGILQEVGSDYAFQEFSLCDIQNFVASEIEEYQSDKSHQPKLFDLHELGLHGTVSYCKELTTDASTETLPTADAQQPQRSQYLVEQDNEYQDNYVDGQSSVEICEEPAEKHDDLVYLVRQSLIVLDLLARYSADYETKLVQHFMRSCPKARKYCESEEVKPRDKRYNRSMYDLLIDVWSMPPEKQIRLFKRCNLFWQPPSREIDAHKRDILNRQIESLADFINERPSLVKVEDSFERIADTFYSHIIELHGN
jgi:hypothetical protein